MGIIEFPFGLHESSNEPKAIIEGLPEYGSTKLNLGSYAAQSVLVPMFKTLKFVPKSLIT